MSYGTLGRRGNSSVIEHGMTPMNLPDVYPTNRYDTTAYMPSSAHYQHQAPLTAHTHTHVHNNGSLRRNIPPKLQFPKDYIRNGSMNSMNVQVSPTSSGSGIQYPTVSGQPHPTSPTKLTQSPILSTFASDHNNGIPMEQRGHLV